MDRKVSGVLLVLAIAAFLAVAGCTGTQEAVAPASGDETGAASYVVGIDGEYPPYSFIDADGNPQGFDVESIQWIAEQKGFNVKIQPVAWDGIIPALLAGKIDMVYSGMTITPERAEVVTFSVPYWQVNQSVATHDDTAFTMDDFMAGDLMIGAQRGTTGQFWVEENLIAEVSCPLRIW
jgi:polar amino acid transport system substrate-binding protein